MALPGTFSVMSSQFVPWISSCTVQKYVQETPMEAISYTAARRQLAQTMQPVCDDHAPLIITRSKAP